MVPVAQHQKKNQQFLLYFPTNRNPNFLTTALLFFHAAFRERPELKKKFKLIIAASPSNEALIKLLVESYKQEGYDIDCVVGTEYLEKLKAVFSKYTPKQYQYFIKHDDDVFIPPQVWRKLIELSPSLLEKNKEVYLTTVNLSTGIPSWSYFVKSFFTKRFVEKLEKEMANKRVPPTIWGHDYSKLNAFIASKKKWDENGYWKVMNKLGYHYRGLHPLRLYIVFSALLNEKIIKNFASFYSRQPLSSWNTVKDRYLCNNFFVIPYASYRELINSKELFLDPFDELPLNRYLLKHKKAVAYLKDSVAVHVAYNTIYDQTWDVKGKHLNGRQLELHFVRKYFELIAFALKNQKDLLITRMQWYSEPLTTRFVHSIGERTRTLPVYPMLARIYEMISRKGS